jgi:Methyltransferase domain
MAARGSLVRLRRIAEDAARRALEPAGYQLSRRNFYSPIPIVEELPPNLWDGPAGLPGVDLRVEEALALLNGPLLPYFAEFRPPLRPPGSESPSATQPGGPAPTESGGFWLDNRSYGCVDAETLYAMLRHLKPARLHELGSGASTHVIHLAALANAEGGSPLEHTVFDPYPYTASPMGPVPGVSTHPIRTEDLDPVRFAALHAGDVLFVDTTHTVRTGGDVTHIFLEILPRLAPGVLIHIHDIFLPYEYPREWVVDRGYAWAEQYLLQAFLAFNHDFEVALPNYALACAAPDALEQAIPSFDPHTVRPGAFWFRRRA